ncbi:MAG: hypothetical protein J3K34DRAFT_517103 [Monoraphidium minutum]|nr:MAG: hypothetical protein J3K34DRAFT_517103 [Monoraphidium minutum]
MSAASAAPAGALLPLPGGGGDADALLQQQLLLQQYQQQLAAAGCDAAAAGAFDYGQAEFPPLGVNLIPAGVVGTFFPVERPRPPPAGDQVNFAQRIMEICFAAVSQWPMGLQLQFVVDGSARGPPVDVTVGRSICKSQVSGSRQVIYYVRNPPLLRLARSFDARTVGYRLAGPTTLEWHLSTAPAPPAAGAVAKASLGKRKAGAKGPRASGGALDCDEWAAVAASPAAGAAQLHQQVLLLQQQLGGAGAGDAAAAAALGAGALQQQPLAVPPPALLGQLSNWLSAQQALAPGAPFDAAAFGAPAQAKRRKQRRPSRAPFYAAQTGGPSLFGSLMRYGSWGSASDGGSDGEAAYGSKRMRLAGPGGGGGAFGGLMPQPRRASAA